MLAQQETEEPKIAEVTKTIVVHRLCADGEPLGRTIPKEVRSPDIVIENMTISESSNEQTTDSHEEETSHKRTRKDTIKRGRTHDCTTFALDQDGKINQANIKLILEQKLFGAFRNVVPTYLNSADCGRQMSSVRIIATIESVGEIEAVPESQMVETNGMTKGTIWRYAEVLSEVKATVTFRSALLKQKKLQEFVDKTLSQRIGKFHNVSQQIGWIEV